MLLLNQITDGELAASPVCTEKSIQLETQGIQPGGVLPKNLSCVILGRSVEPGWRRTSAKFAPVCTEKSIQLGTR